MSGSSEPAKLAELRTKTDRELIRLIGSQLELGFSLAAQAADTISDKDCESARQSHARAEDAYSEARRFLSVVFLDEERRQLEVKLKQLREALDGLSAWEEAQARTTMP